MHAFSDFRIGALLRRCTLAPALALFVLAASVGSAVAHAQKAPAEGLTLEQAVAKVQRETGGKVLAADTQRRGKIIEYRIKVLTPQGHVRVVPVRTEADKADQGKEKR